MPMVSRTAIVEFALHSNPATTYGQSIMDVTTNISFFDTNRWGNSPKIMASLKFQEWLGAKKILNPVDVNLSERWMRSSDMQEDLYDIR